MVLHNLCKTQSLRFSPVPVVWSHCEHIWIPPGGSVTLPEYYRPMAVWISIWTKFKLVYSSNGGYREFGGDWVTEE